MTPQILRVALVCGDRNWSDSLAIRDVLDTFPEGDQTVVITGGARGADIIAWHIAKDKGFRNIRIDAPWEAFGKRAGPVRNQWMLDLLLMMRSANHAPIYDVHAFHGNIASSKGTADMLSRARAAGVAYTIHTGRTEET